MKRSTCGDRRQRGIFWPSTRKHQRGTAWIHRGFPEELWRSSVCHLYCSLENGIATQLCTDRCKNSRAAVHFCLQSEHGKYHVSRIHQHQRWTESELFDLQTPPDVLQLVDTLYGDENRFKEAIYWSTKDLPSMEHPHLGYYLRHTESSG